MIIRRDKDWAQQAWERMSAELDDPYKHFGPDYSPKITGDYFWEVQHNGETIGFRWARRYTKAGGVMSIGRGIFKEYRRTQPRADRRADMVEVIRDIYRQVPQCKTIVSIIWGCNDLSMAGMQKYGRKELGVIPVGDVNLHIFLVHQRS